MCAGSLRDGEPGHHVDARVERSADEFGLVRFAGDAERAAAVYAGVAEPLVAEDIADCVAWVVTRPHHVNIDRLVVRPLAQAAQHKVHRVP